MLEAQKFIEETKEKKRKVYGSYGHEGDANWIIPLGFEYTLDINEADVVVFGGGKDVDPGFYGEKRMSRTDSPSERDKREKEDFLAIQELRKKGKNVLSLGICRGHQLLVALSGGELIQDVGNHHGSHSIATFDKKKFTVNSIHHQMVFPYNMDRKDYKILAWSTENISSRYLNGMGKAKWLPVGFKEIEVIYLPKTHSIGYQSHPEMMFNNKSYKDTVSWMQELFMKAYNKTI